MCKKKHQNNEFILSDREDKLQISSGRSESSDDVDQSPEVLTNSSFNLNLTDGLLPTQKKYKCSVGSRLQANYILIHIKK